MNRREKEVLQAALKDEKHTIKLIERVYGQARKDCEKRIADLNARTDMQNIQSIVYQKQYQEILLKQINDVLDGLHGSEFATVSEYLGKCYETGFYGTLYDLQGQGVPLVFPIRQDQVVKALEIDSQLKKPLYESLGEDVERLKKSIRAEISRGVANGSSYLEMATKIATGMNSPFNRAMNRTFLITRTEGHRVQEQAAMDTRRRAKECGADIVKMWDATLDKKTRDWHLDADGQVKELDEPFIVDGEEMEAPGIGGSARNVCNCRCFCAQRARWALGSDETRWLGDTSEMTDERREVIASKLGVKIDELDKISKSVVKVSTKDGFEEFKKQILPKVATNRKEAYELITKDIGFHDASKSLSYIDEETIVAQANQLSKLNSRFHVISEGHAGYVGAENSKNFVAVTKGSFKSATSQNLVYSFDSYAHGKEYVIQEVEKSIKTGWSMPCLPENYLVYTTTHEYGHMLENKLMSEMVDMDAFWEKYRKAVGTGSPAGLKRGEKVLRETSNGAAKTIFREIQDIAKENNPDLSLRANISDYGASCYQEAFAEIFANSQLGKPNELGKAMNIWLERKGF